MNFLSRRTKRNTEISILNLIDVIFMLLIFFMIATTFNNYAQFQLSVPKADTALENSKIVTPEIIINKDRRYYLKLGNGIKEISLGEMEREFSKMDSKILNGVTITADENLEYKVIVEVMGKLKNQGIENINLSIQKNIK